LLILIIPLILYLVVTNLITYRAFANDKRYAIEKQQRTPEATLLFWAAIGGWFGAKIAQKRLLHKSSKQPFGSRLNDIGILYALSFGTFMAITTALFFLAPPDQINKPPIQASKLQAASNDSASLKTSLRPPATRPASR
jgi:uncharacterized membrane protein YsdA (DUF1294 family)